MNILLVDDDQDMADYLISNLTNFGFNVHHLLSGVETLSYLKKNKTDLLLLDWNMPVMTGLDVLMEVRKVFSPSDLPIIMVTSINETKNIVSALSKGCNDYITKPVNIETVAARMQTQFSIKKLHDDNAAKFKLEAINEVITTLNHEINNPLFIALNHVRKASRREDYTQLDKVENALVRITNIVRQISDLNIESKEFLKQVHTDDAA
ncbi:MAG: response regulator [Rhizobacter sp.]|nr:response regulator [Bacteriovorax sp.]